MNENFTPLENVINPKSLERQIKIIEQRLTELQSETSALEKRREACHILLGLPVVPMGTPVEAATATPPRKATRPKKKDRSDEAAEDENQGTELPEEVSVIRASELHA